jgi:hypothetical protein
MASPEGAWPSSFIDPWMATALRLAMTTKTGESTSKAAGLVRRLVAD